MKNLLKSFLQQFFNLFWGQYLEHSCALRDFSMYPGPISYVHSTKDAGVERPGGSSV